MNVWIVNHYAGAPSMPTGCRHYYLARHLQARGHRATLIASSFTPRKGHQQLLAPSERAGLREHAGVPILWLRTPPYQGNSLGRVRNMATFAWELERGWGLRELPPPEVIVGSSPHLLAAWAAQRQACRRRVPFVMEVRDLWPQTFIDLGEFSARHPVMRTLGRLECHLYRRAARVITLGPRMGDYLQACGVPPDRVTWIPNGVDLAQLPSPPPAPGGRPLTVMYVGAHGLANALETVVEAAALVERQAPGRLRFRFIGEGPVKSQLIEHSRRLGLTAVYWEDPVPKQQVPLRLQEADLLVVSLRDSPLYRWGLSFNKMFDYLAAARPIASGGAAAANDPVAEAGAGLSVPPEDPAALAQALLTLAALTPAEREAMGQRGRRYVAEHHDWERLAQRYEQVLQEACAGGRSS